MVSTMRDAGSRGRLFSVEDVQDVIRSSDRLSIGCRTTKWAFSVKCSIKGDPERDLEYEKPAVSLQEFEPVGLRYLRGVVEYCPADQVVTVNAGARVFELQKVLAEHGQCIP